MNRTAFIFALFAGITICPLQAQMTSSSSTASWGPTQSSPQRSPAGRPVRQQPCWQQAGISSSTVQQYREIMRNTRQEVESVCSDTSLSQSQKQEKIHQLRAEARQQAEALVTSQQLQALESCRKQRGEGHRGMHNAGAPCAGTLEASPSQP